MPLALFVPPVLVDLTMASGRLRQSRSEMRIEHQRPLEKLKRLHDFSFPAGRSKRRGAQVKVVTAEILEGATRSPLDLCLLNARLDCGRDLQRDPILERKDVL